MTRVSLRGLAARPLRTALTALAIVLGVAMVAASFTFTDTMRGAADALSSSSYDGTAAVVSSKTAFEVGDNDWAVQKPPVPAAMLERVRQVPGVGVAVGDVTDHNTKIIGKDGKPHGEGPYFGVGFDSKVPGAERLTPFRLTDGRWAVGPNEVVIDQATSEDQVKPVGSSVRISGAGGTADYRVVGVASFGNVKTLGTATAAVFDLPTAQKVAGKDGRYDSILVGAQPGVDAGAVRASLSSAVGPEASVQTAAAHDRFTFDGLKMFIGIIKIVLLVFGGVAILVGAFTIFNALSITVAQRTRELGLLRMVGASRAQVMRGVLLEALALGVLASAVGVLAGLGLAKGLESFFTALGLDLPRAEMVLATRTIVVAAGVGILVTLLAGLLPARRATRVAPIDVLHRTSALPEPKRFGRAVRAAASALGRPVQAVGGTAGALARRNAMRQPGRTASTAAALTIGVALTTMVVVVATGLKDTTRGSLERRIDAPLVLTSQDGWSPVDAAVQSAAAGAPGVTAVSGFAQDGAQAFGDVEVVNGVDPQTIGSVFRFDWAQGDDSLPAKLGSNGAIVDEGWAKENGLTVGERFELTSARGETLDLEVLGIESSPVLDVMSLGPVTIGREAYERIFPAAGSFLTLIGGDPETEAVEAAVAGFPDANVQTLEAFIAERSSDIDMLLAVFAVLLALAVIVSLFGIVNTLVLSTFERTRELGMLRAVGMSRRQVRRMVRGESVITALLGAASGIVVGLGLAWIVTRALEDEGLTFAVPLGALAIFTVVAVLAGVLAAVIPARRASRLDVLGALAYE